MALENVNIGLANYWKVTCLDKDGNVKWEENKKSRKCDEKVVDTPFVVRQNLE